MTGSYGVVCDEYQMYCIDASKVCIAGSIAASVALRKIPLIVAPLHGAAFAVCAVSLWLGLDRVREKAFPYDTFDPEYFWYNVAFIVTTLALSVITTTYLVHEGVSLVNKNIHFNDVLQASVLNSLVFFFWTHFYDPYA